jgi:type 1 glutamine amidotransferase
MKDALRFRAPCLAFLVLVSLAGRMAAQAVSEPFDYSLPGADLLGESGGTGFDGPWFASGFNASIHDNYDVAAGSLIYPNLAVSGNRIESASTPAIAGLGRNLEVPVPADATATVYFSLLLRPEGSLGQGALNGYFGAYLDGTGNADLFAGKPGSASADPYVIEDRGGSGQVQSSVAPVIGETVLLVVRAELRPGTDVFTLHVNPDPCQPEPASGTVKSDLDLGDVSALVIYSTGAFSLDELRLGASFAEVVPCETPPPGDRVLVFSKTAGFRHDSIAAGIAAVQALGAANGFAVDATESATFFNDASLARYDAVIFLNTTGDILNASQEAAFERYIGNGRGFVGIHSAADTEYDWAWYGGLVGAYFQSHPAIQAATVVVADRVHPASAGLPVRWTRTDEWYNFRTNPRGRLHVLATLDETTYSGGTMGEDHPITWCHRHDGGRAFYTAGGHTIAAYSEPLFRQHLLEGIRFAAGWVVADCDATVDASFDKVVLDAQVNEPMELAVADDGRVFFVQRGGALKIYKPSTSSTVTAGALAVTTANEDGLIGITLDPDFAANGWIYLFHSPAGSVPKQHISRFHMDGDQLDQSSEVVLLEIPTQRDQCCHSAGEWKR